MATIALTKGYSTTVDDSDVELLRKFSWSTAICGSKIYARAKINGQLVFMHRFLMNAPKGKMVDHEDRNGLNNRRDNLRFCTKRQNQSNTGLAKNNVSGYKGVSWDKATKKWTVQVSINDIKVYLGQYLDIKDAARAYNAKALETQGEFAFQNPIED